MLLLASPPTDCQLHQIIFQSMLAAHQHKQVTFQIKRFATLSLQCSTYAMSWLAPALFNNAVVRNIQTATLINLNILRTAGRKILSIFL